MGCRCRQDRWLPRHERAGAARCLRPPSPGLPGGGRPSYAQETSEPKENSMILKGLKKPDFTEFGHLPPFFGSRGPQVRILLPRPMLSCIFRLRCRGSIPTLVRVLFRVECYPGAPLACRERALGLCPFEVKACGVWGAVTRQRHHALLGHLGIAEFGHATMPACRQREILGQLHCARCSA